MHTKEYLEWKKSYTKVGTYPNYVRWINRFRQFLDRNDEHFTLEDVSRFRVFLSACEYSPRNIQYGLYIIRDYLGYLTSLHGLNFPLKLFKIKQQRSKSHYAVTEEEFTRMIAILPQNEPIPLQRKLMLRMLFETGVRVGELTNLRLSDLQSRSAVIRNEKNHRNRIVGWSETTEKLLQFYLPLREQLDAEDDWLFISFKWKPCKKLSTRQLERIVCEIRKEAGLTNVVRPHSFRHGFVHRKLEEGVPITTVSQMLGHSSTMNVINYAQLSSLELRKAWKL